MSQPAFVQNESNDRIRPSARLAPSRRQAVRRPGEYVAGDEVPNRDLTGPDLGFGLKLAQEFDDSLQLGAGEDHHDALIAGFVCAIKRSSLLGRAPCIADLEWAYTLLGYLGKPPKDLIAKRIEVVRGIAHDEQRQERLSSAVSSEAMDLSAEQLTTDNLNNWKKLLRMS